MIPWLTHAEGGHVEPVLLECNLGWDAAGGIPSASLRVNSWAETAPGMPKWHLCHPGPEHPGGPTRPMGRKARVVPFD